MINFVNISWAQGFDEWKCAVVLTTTNISKVAYIKTISGTWISDKNYFGSTLKKNVKYIWVLQKGDLI